MAKYAISQEGADAMKALAKGLLSSANSIIDASRRLAQITASLSDGLGIYADEIGEIINNNTGVLLKNKEDIEALAATVYNKSEQILQLSQLMLDGSSGDDMADGSSQANQSKRPSPSQLDEIKTVRSPYNNTFFVPNANYEKYIQIRDAFSNEYTTESFIANGTDYVVNIDPSLIEGIDMSENEAKDLCLFWNRGQTHEIESEEFFTNVAANIPAVRQLLDSGMTPEEIMLNRNENLSDCYSLYFANPVYVTDCGGFYEFSSGGRHRILAARSFGYDIPVRVTGRYVRKS